MQDAYTGQPGSFIAIDGIRIPESDLPVYQHDKRAYKTDPAKARKAFAQVKATNQENSAAAEANNSAEEIKAPTAKSKEQK